MSLLTTLKEINNVTFYKDHTFSDNDKQYQMDIENVKFSILQESDDKEIIVFIDLQTSKKLNMVDACGDNFHITTNLNNQTVIVFKNIKHTVITFDGNGNTHLSVSRLTKESYQKLAGI